nr:MAG TPA: hypothetical protein [Caudoviricetes sp.]
MFANSLFAIAITCLSTQKSNPFFELLLQVKIII